MNELTEMGEAFYAESGVVLKLVGVLRAADIYLNPDKRYLYCRTPLCSFWKFKTVFGSIWDTDSSIFVFFVCKKVEIKRRKQLDPDHGPYSVGTDPPIRIRKNT